jgi:hypothetical protein
MENIKIIIWMLDIGKLKTLFPDVFCTVARKKYTVSVWDVEKVLSESKLEDVISVHETRKMRLDWDYRGRAEA